jgi:hypothetical protein
LSDLTGGRLAGLPLRLSLDWREVADPTGTTRAIGVWSLRFMPPQTIELEPRTWRQLAGDALAEGEAMRLPVPTVETVEDAVNMPPEVDLDTPSRSALAELKEGPRCDARFYQQMWFARVKDSPLDHDEARAIFLNTFTEGAYDSLTTFLQQATEGEAAALLAAAGAAVAESRTPEQMKVNAQRYVEIFGDDSDASPPAESRTVDTTTGEVVAPIVVTPPVRMTKAELWRENRRLADHAAGLGLRDVAVLTARATEDEIAAANAVLLERIENIEIDQALAQETLV